MLSNKFDEGGGRVAKGIYYIGRVLKLQLLNQDKLIRALNKPAIISSRANSWTFIDIEEYNKSGHHFIYGKLSKFLPDGEVTIVDPKAHSETVQDEPNLKIASSPFVYIPEHSGIAFLNVNGHIEQKMFIKKFCEIVQGTYDNYFVECDIDLISDLRTFSSKLSSFDQILQISAKISPPNPLFSPLWEELEKYLRERKTDKMTIIEDASQAEPLQSYLPELVQEASEQTKEKQFYPDYKIPIGDV